MFLGLSTRRTLCTGAAATFGGGRRVRFIYNGETEVPFFWRNRLERRFYEEDYASKFQEAYLRLLAHEDDPPARADPNLCMRAVDAIGQMPLHREIAMCTVPRLFDGARGAIRVRPWMGQCFWFHDVVLRRRHLRHSILSRELAAQGEVRRTRYVRLMREIEEATVRHAVEVDLREQQGQRYVVFLARNEMSPSGVRRELARDGISVEGLNLKLWMPEEVPPPRGWAPYAGARLRRFVGKAKQHERQRLSPTHCRIIMKEEQPYEENYLDPRRPPTFRKDYTTSNFDAETMELDMELERQRQNGNHRLKMVTRLVPVTKSGIVLGTRLERSWQFQ